MELQEFIVYGPKKPDLPANSTELGHYNLMADFSIDTAPGESSISQGVLKKYNTREFTYVGAGWNVAFDPNSVEYAQVRSGTNGDYVEYSFWGTGLVLRGRAFTDNSNDVRISVDGSNDLSGLTVTAIGSWVVDSQNPAEINQNAAAQRNAGVAITGMTLGFHTVRFTNNTGAAQNLTTSAIEIITPVHVPSADRNLLRDDMIGSNSLSSDVALPEFRKGKVSFPEGVDLGANGYEWQTKELLADVTSATTDIGDLRFTGLEVGKTYRLDMLVLWVAVSGDAEVFLDALNDGNILYQARFRNGGSNHRDCSTISVTFTAAAPVLSFAVSAVTGTVYLGGADSNTRTRMTLTELPNHKKTNKW